MLERQPELRNRNQSGSILARFDPRMLRDAEIEGQTMLQFVIERDDTLGGGTVAVISSAPEHFADVWQNAVEKFRFSLGQYEGQPVRVLIRTQIA